MQGDAGRGTIGLFPAGIEGTMDESLRTLEQKALRNVRTLVETLEREELRKRKRQKYLVAAGSFRSRSCSPRSRS